DSGHLEGRGLSRVQGPRLHQRLGARPAPDGGSLLTVYVLDSTVLIGYLRDTPSIGSWLRRRLGEGHTLATTCVNLTEVERGLHPRERRRAAAFLDALRFLVTD